MDNNTNIKQNSQQLGDGSTVKVLFNKVYVATINKEKLLSESLYFQAALKQNCKLSPFIEVNVEASRETFKQVARFIGSGRVQLCKNNIFKIHALARYLGVNGLQQLCLDYFLFGLTSGNVANRLKSSDHLDDFKQVALQFKKSGKRSVSGLYFLVKELNKKKRHLKMFCMKTKRFRNIEIDLPTDVFNDYELERFSSKLVISCRDKHFESNNFLVLYDLASGKAGRMPTGTCSQTILCSSSDALVTFSVVENNNVLFSVYKTTVNKKIDLRASEKLPLNGKFPTFDRIHLLFAHAANDKMYVFYCEDKKIFCETRINFIVDVTNELHMLTFCLRTFSVVRDEKVVIENVAPEKTLTIDVDDVVKGFYVEKEQKLLIDVRYNIEYKLKKTLIFDIKKQSFSLETFDAVKDVMKHSGYICSGDSYKMSMVGGTLYALYTPTSYRVPTAPAGIVQVSTFKVDLKPGGGLKGGKVVCRSDEQQVALESNHLAEAVCLVNR